MISMKNIRNCGTDSTRCFGINFHIRITRKIGQFTGKVGLLLDGFDGVICGGHDEEIDQYLGQITAPLYSVRR